MTLARATTLAASVLLASVLLAGSAQAQHEGITGDSVPDVPAGEGTIRGSVVAPGGGAVADLPVLLYALPHGGTPGLRRGRTDAQGSFAFEGVSTDPETAWMVGTRYREVPFAARAAFEAGQKVVEVSIGVSEPSADTSAVRVGPAEWLLDWLGASVAVVRTQRLENPSGRVINVPEAGRAGREPLLDLELPEGATEVQLAFGLEGVEREGRHLRFWGPLYPGPYDVRVSYLVPASAEGATLVERLPSGASEAHVLVAEGGLEVTGEGFSPGEPVEREGRSFRSLEGGPVAAGGRLALAVKVPEVRVAPEALSLAEVRMWLELDDTALVVSEEHHFKVEGHTPVAGTRAAPLLRIALPEGAELRGLSDDAARLGVVAGENGELLLLGPAPPGESSVGVSYRLRAPARDAMLTLSRHFSRELPLLRVLVADTGVRLESDRLHRRRPVRSGTRNYLQLEGFWIDRGVPAEVRIGRLDPGGGPSRGAAAAVVLLGALAATGFLLAPLRRERAPERQAAAASPTQREREALYDSIRDLDHDYETGKLSEADYHSMRDELRTRAVALLREEKRDAAAVATEAPRTADPAPASAPAAARDACDACGGKLDPDWSFCAHCGAALPGSGRGA